MKPLRLIVASVISASLVATCLFYLKSKTPIAPALRVRHAFHDFGRVKSGTSCSHTFTIENSASSPVTIRSINATCGCVTSASAGTIVPAAGSAPINVSLSTARAAAPQSFKKYVRLGFDSGHPDLILGLTAEIAEDIAVSPNPIIVPVGGSPFPIAIECRMLSEADFESVSFVSTKYYKFSEVARSGTTVTFNLSVVRELMPSSPPPAIIRYTDSLDTKQYPVSVELEDSAGVSLVPNSYYVTIDSAGWNSPEKLARRSKRYISVRQQANKRMRIQSIGFTDAAAKAYLAVDYDAAAGADLPRFALWVTQLPHASMLETRLLIHCSAQDAGATTVLPLDVTITKSSATWLDDRNKPSQNAEHQP